MLEGISVKPLKKFTDERGFFAEIMRQDMEDILDGQEIVQTNHSFSYPGIVRAWHRHSRGQNDYFIVLRGVLKICGYDDRSRELSEIISTGEVLQVVRMPGHYWHGFKVVSNEPAYLLYFVNKLYDYANPDEERRPWDDRSIIPLSINGSKSDPRCGKPWDWFHSPHR